MSALPAAAQRRELPPVRARGRWIAWGLALQVVGAGIPLTAAIRRAHEDGVRGDLTHYTIRLIWHELLRSGADVALIVLGMILFAAGAVVLARPLVRRRSTLLIAVPLAAIAGLAVLGVLALVAAAVIAVAEAPNDVDWLSNFSFGPPRGRGRRRK